jgi:hypothetical protein
MSDSPLDSLANYCRFVAEGLNRSTVIRSTVSIWSDSPCTGIAEGEVFFTHGLRLRMREELDFDAGLITSYGYEVYQGNERLFWYDDFPHPNDPLWPQPFLIINMCRRISEIIAFRLPR